MASAIFAFVFLALWLPKANAGRLMDVRIGRDPADCAYFCTKPVLVMTQRNGKELVVHRWALSKTNVVESPDPYYSNLIRPCGAEKKSKLGSADSISINLSCWKVHINVTDVFDKPHDMQAQDGFHSWRTPWVVLPSILFGVALVLAIIAFLIQRRRARSFKLLFEEHLIQTAATQPSNDLH